MENGSEVNIKLNLCLLKNKVILSRYHNFTFMEGLSYQSAWTSDVPTQFSRGQGFQEALALVILASEVMWKMNFWIIQCFHNHFASVASVWRGRSSTVAIWSQYKKKEERKLSWGGCLFSKLNALSMCPSKKLLHCLIIQSHCSHGPLQSPWPPLKNGNGRGKHYIFHTCVLEHNHQAVIYIVFPLS